MNILELDSYNLADAVKFNEKLNPRIWQGDKMKPQVRAKLLQIAEDFKQSLGLSDLEVKDITVSGSNAGYTYTPSSDIDLHLVVDLPQADSSDVYRELFDAKKFQYNETHNITIGGYDVELYVENANEPPVSQGMYSVVSDDWINIPKKRRASVDDNAVKSKYDVMKHRIESAIASKSFNRISTTAAKIKKMRQAGLDKHGELGPENLAYKMLRTQGTIKALYDARTAAQDKKLSLKEQPKKPHVTYGFREDVGITPDGVSPSTKMFLSETDDEQTVSDFIKDTAEFLGIENMPDINLHSDAEWGEQNQSFGRFDPETNELHVNLANRHIMDVLRTTAHELAHCRQHEISELPFEAGKTGSPWENEAHAVAGIVMRNYADKHPEMFQGVDLNEGASGYIPKNKKEARDPRYSMAVTVDIKPGQVGKEANKLALNTGKNGEPTLLMKSANLQESLARELELFESGQDLFEVKMTSKNLAKLAQDIKGVKVGLEFEMIVPNATVDDDDNQEPDYDYDEEVRDIDDAVNFFDDGDYNYGRTIRNLREEMENSYQEWVMNQIDSDWDDNGFEFFQEYLDREEPFDPEDYEDRAEEEVKADYPDLDPTSDEFNELKSEKLREINAEYYVETWEAQGRSYDHAREEFDEEKRGDYSERDWLRDQGIRYASDVINEYTDLTWPHWTTFGGGDTDVKAVALDFMNAIGDKSVAISNSYHGSYEKWNGSEWVRVGSDKPDDCFTIEPDGSLDGDESSDAGLEFVSPPIPLEDIGNTMKKVQDWAGTYGAYTGKNNKTSIHTNISVPGYDLKNLDYLKAALLLGDEYVLREFDRIGNSYAKPAIEKVKQLVQQKPEKAKELMDKMKSQLNAEASKLIHSGVTDKFTSINTKDNRVEFRSPGGDYLSIIADNPQKMVDTINRMVVTLDAAMDPNKYKQEYQKKLYKVLTGQGGGREAKTGAKQEMKASDKDLLNIFSRYAAGELPKQALKSFVRQAQLERKVARQKDEGVKMWWNVARDGQRIEVVATNEMDAKLTAAKEWGIVASDANLSSMAVKPLRPYDDTAGGSQVVAQQPTTPQWGIWDIQQDGFVNSRGGIGPGQGRLIGGDTYDAARNSARNNGLLDRLEGGEFEIRQIPQQAAEQGSGTYRITTTGGGLIAGDEYGDDQTALQRAQYWAQRRGVDVIVRNPQGAEVGRVSASGEITPAAQSDSTGNWGIWLTSSDRFVRAPGQIDNSVLRRFPSREAAEQFLAQTRGERPDMRTDIEVREIEPAAQEPQGVDTTRDYEIYNRENGNVMTGFQARNDDEALARLTAFRGEQHLNDGNSYGVRRGPGVSAPAVAEPSSVNNLTPHGPGPWEIYRPANGQVMYRLGHTNRNAAETEARTWIQVNGGEPEWFAVRTRQAAPAQQPNWEIRDGSTNRLVHQFYAPDRQEAAIIAGEFYDDNDFADEDYVIQRIESSADAAQGYVNQFATAPGAPNWELERDSDRSIVRRFHAASQGDAIAQAYDYARSQGWNMDDYTLQSADAAQGGIVDVAGEQPATAPQTLTRPGQGQQVFTGTWLVKNENTGEELYRFSGIGNSQADANRYAAIWARRYGNGAPIEVVPEMGPA